MRDRRTNFIPLALLYYCYYYTTYYYNYYCYCYCYFFILLLLLLIRLLVHTTTTIKYYVVLILQLQLQLQLLLLLLLLRLSHRIVRLTLQMECGVGAPSSPLPESLWCHPESRRTGERGCRPVHKNKKGDEKRLKHWGWSWLTLTSFELRKPLRTLTPSNVSPKTGSQS